MPAIIESLFTILMAVYSGTSGLLVGLALHDGEEAASIPARALARGVLVNVTAGRVIRFFPALNIPEEELWPAVETVLALLVE